MKLRNLSLIALALCASGLMADDYATQSTSVPARVKIYRPIEISRAQDLHFGVWIMPMAGVGSVVCDPAEAAVTPAEAMLQLSKGSNHAPMQAILNVVAEPTVAFTASVTGTDTVPTGLSYTDWTIRGDGTKLKTDAQNAVKVMGSLENCPGSSYSFDGGVLGAYTTDGHAQFHIGAKLNISDAHISKVAEQVGNFTVQVSYN